MRQLRDYQREGVTAFRDAWDGGMLRPAAVLATGLGKTDLIADVATTEARAGRRVLAIAHRSELLDQITARCLMHDPSIPVGRVQASRNETRRPITVAMAQTMGNAKRRARMLPPHLLIIDEAHHAAADSYMDIMRWAGCFDQTRAMGLTATMVRGKGRRGAAELGDVWQGVVFTRDIRFGIDHGYLVEPRGRAVVTDHLDLEHAKISKGDYQDGELGEMVAQDVDQIVKAWQEHAADRITVAFTPSIAAGAALATEFRSAGVPVGEVYGSTKIADRDVIYADLAAGRIRVLVSVMVTTEGWDCPPVSCILMARPTKLPGLYTQVVGRGLRPSPGKTDCLVLDVVGASRNQRLVTLVDLHPSAPYDTAELDAIPCEQCGLPTAGEWSALCECVPEPLDRAPASGPRRLLGPAAYEDIDLFAESACAWMFTRRGIRFLPAGDRMAVLWPDSNDPAQGMAGTYHAGHIATRGPLDGTELQDGLPLGEARAVAEAWALAYDPTVATRDASWRQARKSPSEKQVRYARQLGVQDPESMTAGRLSDELSIAIASRRLD